MRLVGAGAAQHRASTGPAQGQHRASTGRARGEHGASTGASVHAYGVYARDAREQRARLPPRVARGVQVAAQAGQHVQQRAVLLGIHGLDHVPAQARGSGGGLGCGGGLGRGWGLGWGWGTGAVWVLGVRLRSTEKKKKPPPFASENWCCPGEISPSPSPAPLIEAM